MMVKDFTGNELAPGDVVLFTYGDSSLLNLGRVVRTTAKNVMLHQLTEWLERTPHQQPGEQQIIAHRVSLISDQMRHLENIEVWLHYKRRMFGEG